IVGVQVGLYVPGLDQYAGYFMAASIFLALAAACARGEHINVTLVIEHTPPPLSRVINRVAHVLSTAVVMFAAFAVTRLAVLSYRLGDVSQGLDAVLLWIPQSVAVFGMWMFALAAATRTALLIF